MQGIPFWKTPEFWTAVLTIVAIVIAHIVPDWKDTIDQLVPNVVILIVILVARTTTIQIAQFARGNTYNAKTNTWEALR